MLCVYDVCVRYVLWWVCSVIGGCVIRCCVNVVAGGVADVATVLVICDVMCV
jgi:hypothetical protein